jgi:sugar phosphate permease
MSMLSDFERRVLAQLESDLDAATIRHVQSRRRLLRLVLTTALGCAIAALVVLAAATHMPAVVSTVLGAVLGVAAGLSAYSTFAATRALHLMTAPDKTRWRLSRRVRRLRRARRRGTC